MYKAVILYITKTATNKEKHYHNKVANMKVKCCRAFVFPHQARSPHPKTIPYKLGAPLWEIK